VTHILSHTEKNCDQKAKSGKYQQSIQLREMTYPRL